MSPCYKWKVRKVATYIVSNDEGVGQVLVHAVVVNGHEHGVDNDAEGDEQVDEGVHDKELHNAREAVPARRALPAEQQLHALVLDPLLL